MDTGTPLLLHGKRNIEGVYDRLPVGYASWRRCPKRRPVCTVGVLDLQVRVPVPNLITLVVIHLAVWEGGDWVPDALTIAMGHKCETNVSLVSPAYAGNRRTGRTLLFGFRPA